MNRGDFMGIQDSTIFDTVEAQLESVGVGIVWFEKPEELAELINKLEETPKSSHNEEKSSL